MCIRDRFSSDSIKLPPSTLMLPTLSKIRSNINVDGGNFIESDVYKRQDQYLDEYTLQYLVKKYSDYIRYPITLYMTKEEPKLDENGKVIEDEYDEIRELTTLNSMVPIWKKNKNDVTDEMLDNFYMDKFLSLIHIYNSNWCINKCWKCCYT